MGRPRFRPSPGTVIACIALVVACTGTATAATKITGKQIENSSVTTKDVKNKSLRGGRRDRASGAPGRTGGDGRSRPQRAGEDLGHHSI